MATLRELLSELAQNPQRLGEFILDPDAVMDAAELSDEDKRALRSGFTGVIYARLAGMSVDESFQIPNQFQQLPPQFQQLPPQFQQLPPQFQQVFTPGASTFFRYYYY